LLERLRHSRALAWLLAGAGAALLLAVGWWLGREDLAGRLGRAQARIAAEASRANRLAAEHRRLEKRLARAQSSLEKCRGGGGEAPAPPEEPSEARSRLLHEGQAAVLMDGKLVITLEAIGDRPRRARIRVRVVDGKEGVARLGPGGEVSFAVEGRRLRLVVKRLHASSASVLLLPG
jgi:hypothetical protein